VAGYKQPKDGCQVVGYIQQAACRVDTAATTTLYAKRARLGKQFNQIGI
jgi:hypothetical protein